MAEIKGVSYGYEDVLIAPRLSDVRSRRLLPTDSIIAKGVPEIKIPILSANMDTVTEAEMAKTMALFGGVGVIHRFMKPEDEAIQVKDVKGRMRIMEDDPPKLPDTATIEEVLTELRRRERGYVILYSGGVFDGIFSGIVTPRDYDHRPLDMPVSKVMTPREKVLSVPFGTNLDEAVIFMRDHRIQKAPVVDDAGNLKGVYTLKDADYIEKHPLASLDTKGRLLVGAAIGVKDDDVKRAHLLVDAGADFLVLDIAHGGLIYTKEMLNKLKREEGIKLPIIAGNVANEEGVIYLQYSGADGAKIGVGPGSVCETRNVAGVGVGQVTAIMESRKAVGDDFPLIADGGIREPGDVSKAMGAGADTVMIGGLLAGTDKSPGEIIPQGPGQYAKLVRGMASRSAFEDKQKKTNENSDDDLEDYVAEGTTTLTPYRGARSTRRVLRQLQGGLQSGMSYVGAHIPREMRYRTIFYVKPPSGSEQGRPISM